MENLDYHDMEDIDKLRNWTSDEIVLEVIHDLSSTTNSHTSTEQLEKTVNILNSWSERINKLLNYYESHK